MIKAFCDFDGTISTIDIGYDLLGGTFGLRNKPRAMTAILRARLTPAALDDYLRAVDIDAGFSELHAMVNRRDIPLIIVSDGFDLYINRFLELKGFTGLEVFSNHAELMPDGSLDTAFPHVAENCACNSRSILCKRNVVLGRSSPDDRIIYIGDGASDYCPAEHADIIFAKYDLAAYCNANGLPHYPFKTLADVARQIELLAARPRIRARHQAELKRKAAWEGE